MWRQAVEDELKLEHIILEVQRLWPPFFGGRRLCTEVCVCMQVCGWCTGTMCMYYSNMSDVLYIEL